MVPNEAGQSKEVSSVRGKISETGPQNKSQIEEIIIISAIFLCLFLGFNITTSINLVPSGDVVSATLLPYSIITQHNLNFDYFAREIHLNPGLDYAFVERNGHYYSFFPIVTPVLATPVYAGLYSVYTLLGLPVSVDDMALWGKIAASIFAALSGVIFYLITRTWFSRKVSIAATFLYAFATSTWCISAGALWQHGTTNLLFLLACYFVVKNEQRLLGKYVLAIGALIGLAAFNRIPDTILFIPFIAYVLLSHREKLWYFVLGLAIALPFLVYNIFVIGSPLGGYASHPGYFSMLHEVPFTAISLLFSPNNGFFVFNPVLLLAAAGMPLFLMKFGIPAGFKRVLVMSWFCGAVLMLFYSGYDYWYAASAFSYGERFLTGLIPMLALSLGVVIEKWKDFGTGTKTVITGLIIISVIIQVIGVTCYPYYPDDKKAVGEDVAWDFQQLVISNTALYGYNRVEFFNVYSLPPFPSVVYWKIR